MSEIDIFISKFEQHTQEIIRSEDEAQKFLIESGIYTQDGNLSKEYR